MTKGLILLLRFLLAFIVTFAIFTTNDWLKINHPEYINGFYAATASLVVTWLAKIFEG